jgi:Molecular chaperone
MEKKQQENIIAIDLGTTNYCVAVMKDGKPVVIPNSEGAGITPSVIAFTKEGEVLVGDMAKRQAITNSERTIKSIIRNINTNRIVKIDDNKYTYQELATIIFKKIKKDAEAYLGKKVSQAVITIPAYFNYNQIKLIKYVARIAGLEVLRYITAPVAGSLAYGFDKMDLSENILVYDLGGGTFNVSILNLGDGVFEVLSTNGDINLGGDDFDEKIMKYIADKFKSENGIDLFQDKMAVERLKEAAETAKIELSSSTQTNIYLPYITSDATGSKHMELTLTRATFNEITSDLVERTIEQMKKALTDANLLLSDIDKIILIGGSTRIPAVVEKVKNFTGKEPSKEINQNESAALGLAIQAGLLTGEVKDTVLLDVTNFSLGIESADGVFMSLIERNITIPTKKSTIFSTSADNQTSVQVNVYQGERVLVMDNELLGRLTFSGIAPASKGIPQIEVALDIDANGIVKVLALDKDTGREEYIVL